MALHSPFLSLPAEIRCRIYEYVSLDAGGLLLPSRRGNIISSSSLLSVSRAVNDEYMETLRLTAPILSSVVQDFRFEHVVDFLDNLLEREAEKTTGEVHAPIRRPAVYRELDLILSLSRDCKKNLPALDDWLKRVCSQPTDHYGTAFTTKYSAHDSTSAAPITLMRVIDIVHCDWYMQASTGPLKEEMGKVCDCLGEVEMRINRLRTNAPPSGPRMGSLETF